MALKGAAITWLMNLPEGSISSFEELCLQFVANFKGSYERHLTFNDLRFVCQRPDEMIVSTSSTSARRATRSLA